ncbi:MAG TPA: (deoxy)nucleoside triphosphate pyrophosphohydrolase [Candidatus Acidoferrales bacterium]|jgi:8-oxo-dGTP diphosphatase|nr:(deoxy)nucleoside triphosphate pyrophosphohydrolase [Candidatus Acidoferrales bacterium]
MKTVVAAIIVRDSRILICQRSRKGSFPLKWEFPGGKVEPGEDLQSALVRELYEELGIRATIGRELWRTIYQYPGLPEPYPVIFNQADAGAQVPKMDPESFEQIAWVAPAELGDLDLLPANAEVIVLLISGELGIG